MYRSARPHTREAMQKMTTARLALLALLVLPGVVIATAEDAAKEIVGAAPPAGLPKPPEPEIGRAHV